MYGLIDCNNFFASCEELFCPKLKGKPIVVLSNNDGCAIARSKSAKALGIPMGAPLFEYADFFKRHGVVIFSSNFELYSDMSKRVMETIESMGYDLEPYSIDETFVDLPDVNSAKELKNRILQWTGIPVSIGLGTTKTQAKLANKIAKSGQGVHLFEHTDLKAFPVEDVWGIGAKSTLKLKSFGVYTAYNLTQKDDHWIRKRLSVMGLRTAWELRGTPAVLDLPISKKGIVSSRSFATAIEDKDHLLEAIMNFVAKGARKLRKEKARAGYLEVFVSTSRFKEPHYSNSCGLSLPLSSSFNPTLMKHTRSLFEKIYRPGLGYKRAGIFLGDITTANQLNLFSKRFEREELMEIFDKTNRRYGQELLFIASQGNRNYWNQASYRSLRYTTYWPEIPSIF